MNEVDLGHTDVNRSYPVAARTLHDVDSVVLIADKVLSGCQVPPDLQPCRISGPDLVTTEVVAKTLDTVEVFACIVADCPQYHSGRARVREAGAIGAAELI